MGEDDVAAVSVGRRGGHVGHLERDRIGSFRNLFGPHGYAQPLKRKNMVLPAEAGSKGRMRPCEQNH